MRPTPISRSITVLFAITLFAMAGRPAGAAENGGEGTGLVAGGRGLNLLPGFEADVLYEVNSETQGSWVALCTGPDGVLFASNQHGEIYRVTLPSADGQSGATQVESLGLGLGGAQGLCWAFDSLYVMVSTKGLYRVSDADNDGMPETAELILPIPGHGWEHGQHAVVLGPDGQSLLLVCGDHINLPELTASWVPQIWGEDQLLPREWDPNGHGHGRFAPGGFVLRVSPSADEVELFSMGFRNPYDLAVNPTGDVFTYDADMEWDMGMPWYRPTRVCHVVSGGEFGWRSGTGKWAADYPDSLPPVLDIGPGSPTGIAFGTGAAFPERYQDALYLLDWTYGTIYALHLTPNGASYSAVAEEFIVGLPLPLTDVVIGDDGAMYFTTGGRILESRLYRVTYTGNESTGRSPTPSAPNELTLHRRALEALHQPDTTGQALETIWGSLGHADRYIRFAARTALEHQPLEQWKQRALDETDPTSSIQCLLALARLGSPDDAPALIDAAGRLDADALTATQHLDLLRLYTVALARMGPIDHARRDALAHRLAQRFPNDNDRLNPELARLLIYLEYPGVIDGCLTLMNRARRPEPPEWLAATVSRNEHYGNSIRQMLESMPPTDSLNYAFMLRQFKTGWTLEQRQAYFLWLNLASCAAGGSSYRGFLDLIRNQALETCTPEEQKAIAPLLDIPDPNEGNPVAPPLGPGRTWTVDEALVAVQANLRGYRLERGAELYRAAMCAQCHRFNGEGGRMGPDLTGVGRTYGMRDLLTGIIEPSAAVPDQYSWSIIRTTEGGQHVGRILLHDEQTIRLGISAVDPTQTLDIPTDQVHAIEPYSMSSMLTGLVNPMNDHELRDLIVYLMSGGDPIAASALVKTHSTPSHVSTININHRVVFPLLMLGISTGLFFIGAVTYAINRRAKLIA